MIKLMYSIYTTEGLILKKMPYGEADFLVRIFARSFGKIDVIAKGARKSVSKLNAHIDILNYIRFSFVKNGDRFSIFTDAEIMERFDEWFVTSDSIALASCIAKTIDLATPQDQENDALLDKTLLFLNNSGSFDTKKNSTQFLREVLAHEGYGQELDFSALPQGLAEGIMKLWAALKI